jgi:excisionase family DNA binding protein
MARNLLSVSECARRHQVARSTIHAAIQRGDLAAVRVGRSWVITETACLAFRPIKDAQEKGARGAAARWADHSSDQKSKRSRHPKRAQGAEPGTE